ncbi:hypothetical protein [Legionella pneumophila]|uniref:hypothetical protein n=1 Tax=Legionella pneumophila TaxID=446 RepID=UPI00399CA090
MDTKILHADLTARILAAGLHDDDLEIIKPYLNDENDYFRLLCACFTRIPNMQNKRLVDILKEKSSNYKALEHEYLGFLLYQAIFSKKLKTSELDAKNINSIHELCVLILSQRKLQLSNEYYKEFAMILKQDQELERYATWILSFSTAGIRESFYAYSGFFKLVFHNKGREYLDVLMKMTAPTTNSNYFFYQAQLILSCYNFQNEKLNEQIHALVSAQKNFIYNQSHTEYTAFQKAASDLVNLLAQEPFLSRFHEEATKDNEKLATYILGPTFVVLAMALVIATPFIPEISVALLVITCFLSAAVMFGGTAATIAAAVDGIFRSKNDEPIRAKEILNNSRYYVGLFKKPVAEEEIQVEGLYSTLES